MAHVGGRHIYGPAPALQRDPLSDIRLMYRSENAINVAGPRLLVHFHDIVETARRRNAAADIGGFLMFDRNRFHQILEGPEGAVDVLFAKISADTRHTNVECLAREAAATRDFEGWSMGSFLHGRDDHPIMRRHGISAHQALDYQPFLRFARDFLSESPAAA